MRFNKGDIVINPGTSPTKWTVLGNQGDWYYAIPEFQGNERSSILFHESDTSWYLYIPINQDDGWYYIDPTAPITGVDPEDVKKLPCCIGHKPEYYVNVGFNTLKLACKYCGEDK